MRGRPGVGKTARGVAVVLFSALLAISVGSLNTRAGKGPGAPKALGALRLVSENQKEVAHTANAVRPTASSAARTGVLPAALVVTTNADSGPGSLRQAILDAGAGDTITFDMNQVVSPISLTSDELLIDKNLTIQGPGANLLAVQRSSAAATRFRIFTINSGTVTISGLTISKGLTAAGTQFAPFGVSGGGILNGGTLTISDGTISGNQAGGDANTCSGNGGNGGGIVNSGTLTIANSTIRDNRTGAGGKFCGPPGGNGGSGGGILNSGTLTISNSTISGNTASGAPGGSGGSGGGLYSSGTLTISNSTLSGNQAGNGGGDLQLIGGLSGGSGGGIYSLGPLTISNCTISGNQTGGGGPGTYGSGGGGGSGGGVFNNSPLTITNSTITGNQTGSGGPGINGNASGGNGGGIAASSSTPPTINNTIIAGNVIAAGGQGQEINGTVNAASSFNLIGTGGSGGLTNGVNNNQVGVGNTGLGPLANNGGPTQTHALLPGSPAIEAGSNAFITNPPFSGPPFTDQRGPSFNRIINGTVDIGAFESGSFTISATSGTPQSTAVNTAFAAPLVATVSSAAGEPVAGGVITFTAPSNGASASFTGGVTTFSATTDANGRASATATANGTVGGPYSVTASGQGIASSASFTLTNSQAATITTVTTSSNTFDFGMAVTFYVTVKANAGMPQGFVQLRDNGTNLGGPVELYATGWRDLTISGLTAGTHTITAEYAGDANFLPSVGTLAGGLLIKAPPSLSINDVSITEGNSGTRTMTFVVTLSAPSTLEVRVDFATANNTATAPSDYVATNGSLVFHPGALFMLPPGEGDTSKEIQVAINGDTDFEPDESFIVTLSNPTNATISKAVGTGTIQNDDPQGGIISFSSANYAVAEDGKSLNITVNRTGNTALPVTVDYATDDTGASTICSAINTGMASSRCDFGLTLGRLKFVAGETQKSFAVPITADAYTGGPETFTVKLANPTGAAGLATPSSASVTINDSAPPAPNANDDTETFVRQHYRDFLNREADAAGLAFWKDNIDQCHDAARRSPGLDEGRCVEVMRINTSAAFFLSIEFKETGLLVRNFYVAALDRPLTNNMPGFVEFECDVQAMQRGVIVGQVKWKQTVSDNRDAFMKDFVTRAEFTGLYPLTDTPAQYVDKLYLHAGITPASSERSNAIAEFSGAATAADPLARGQALFDITQNPGFQTRETNRAFVQMEYFGYLRRDPNDAPDTGFAGYNFWLNKLNAAGDDYLSSEMVKAFLSSLEYRHRFGP